MPEAEAAAEEVVEAPEAAEEVVEAAPEPEKAEPAAEPTNWRESVAGDDLQKIAERFNSPTDAIKAVADLRKQVSTSIRVPGKDATDDDRAAFNKALGVPDSVDGYKFQVPEGHEATDADKAFQSSAAEAFHKLGISADQAAGLNEWNNALVAESQKATEAADKEFAEKTEAALKSEWADDYERNTTLAKRSAAEMLGTDLESVAEMTVGDRLLLDHPAMLRMFAKIGGEMEEGRLGPSLSEGQRSTLQEQADDISVQKFKAMDAGDSAKVKRLDIQERELMSKLHGESGVVGADGRTT